MPGMTVVYGTVCLDLTYLLPSLPTKGGYVELTGELRSLGGEAANTAAALRKWGAKAVLVGNSIGAGEEAGLLAQMLAEEGLGDAVLPAIERPAPVCHIMVTPDGERTMFGRGFVEMETASEPLLVPHIKGGWFTADPNHGKASRRALAEAHGAGMRTYALDFVRDDEVLPPGSIWQSSTSWVGAAHDPSVNLAWLESWLERHDVTALLTDGSDGLYVGDRAKGVRHLPPFPVSPVVDSTGAGDVFRAGMLLGLDEGHGLADSLKLASAAGALKCRRVGAIAGIAERGEIESCVAAHPEVAELYDRAV